MDAEKLALYFGMLGSYSGHFLNWPNGQRRHRDNPTPWREGLMDTGLLKNAKVEDRVTGEVYWTCGGADTVSGFWYAFVWWDRSADHRGNSNSGFYVRGFKWPDAEAAFAYACEQWPQVVARQACPLKLSLSNRGDRL